MLVKLTSLLLLAVLASTITTISSITQPKQDCPRNCGSHKIPFPFGTSPDCYLDDSFLITCNTSISNPPTPFLRLSNIEVLNISLDGQLRVSTSIASDCYNQSGLSVTNQKDQTSSIKLKKFTISSTLNRFTAVGCDTVAIVQGSTGQNYTTGCVSLCDRLGSVVNDSCSGAGCCKTSIPQGVRNFAIATASLKNHSEVLDFNPCSFAFVAEEAAYNFSSLDLKDLQNRVSFPVVVDWAVGNETCEVAKQNSLSYACQAMHSECNNATNGVGYLCRCSLGYEGNPYLIDGCQDINECQGTNPCNGTCTNTPGSFSCSCPKGYEGDGTKDGTGCRPKGQSNGSTLVNVALGISVSIAVLLIGSSWVYWILKKRKAIKLREKFFQQNGGLMLEQRLSNHESSIETAKIFTSEDLKKATNNFDDSRVIGQGGFGTVYKGILPNNKVVAIKKSKISDQSQIEQFINEVVVLSQINHRNVVKLLGCCLDTEVPLLVYEFITNGTLSDHIHNQGRFSALSWETRLKIAAETAGAIAYLHSSTSLPIIHRDIKSTNILLDDTYNAKVADFGASRLVPLDHTQLTTLVQGTFGYLDPEYFHSSQLTEKSDVYSFGVVLAELLTGEKAICFDRPEKDRNLATYFTSAMKEDRLLEILDYRVVNVGKFVQLKEIAKIVQRCLRVKGEERPSMKEIAMELEGSRVMYKHPWVEEDLYPEESENLLGHSPSENFYDGGVSTSAAYDSMKNHTIVHLDNGR